VETNPVPLAVVNGSEDRFVKLDYLDTLAYANLWEGHCHRLAELGTRRSGKARAIFDPILERFFRDVRKWPSRAPCVSYALSSINAERGGASRFSPEGISIDA